MPVYAPIRPSVNQSAVIESSVETTTIVAVGGDFLLTSAEVFDEETAFILYQGKSFTIPAETTYSCQLAWNTPGAQLLRVDGVSGGEGGGSDPVLTNRVGQVESQVATARARADAAYELAEQGGGSGYDDTELRGLATQAAQNASNAVTTAGSAATTAGQAQTTANAASNLASTANGNASTALDAAQAAQTSAGTAVQTANAAATAASAAQETAGTNAGQIADLAQAMPEIRQFATLAEAQAYATANPTHWVFSEEAPQ